MEAKPDRSFLWLVLTVVGILVLTIINAAGFPIFMWLAWLITLGVVIGIAWIVPRLRWPIVVIAIGLAIWQGADELAAKFQLPEPRVTIQQNTTFVEAPENIEDPALREYENEKMGFDDGWLKNSFAGTWLLFMWGFALSQLLNIYCHRTGFALLSVPIELIVFVFGSIIIAAFLWPTGYADPATVKAENTAIFIGAIGPFIWSTVMQFISFGSGMSKGIARSTGNDFIIVIVITFLFPLGAGIFRLFDLNLLTRWFMADALISSAITVQLWTELELSGKFVGMFLPPTIKFCFTLIRIALRRIIGE